MEGEVEAQIFEVVLFCFGNPTFSEIEALEKGEYLCCSNGANNEPDRRREFWKPICSGTSEMVNPADSPVVVGKLGLNPPKAFDSRDCVTEVLPKVVSGLAKLEGRVPALPLLLERNWKRDVLTAGGSIENSGKATGCWGPEPGEGWRLRVSGLGAWGSCGSVRGCPGEPGDTWGLRTFIQNRSSWDLEKCCQLSY